MSTQESTPQPRPARDPAVIAGFAVGVGLSALALLGLPWDFARPDANPWLVYPASFGIGAVLGAAWSFAREPR